MSRSSSGRLLKRIWITCGYVVLRSSEDGITPNAKSVSDIDLLNINDYLANKRVLSNTTRYLIAEFVNSDWSRTDWQSKGLKTKEGNVTVAQALLLLIGLGIENVMPNSGDETRSLQPQEQSGKVSQGRTEAAQQGSQGRYDGLSEVHGYICT